MILIDLTKDANQTFSIVLDELRYNISFIETRGVMSVTIIRNDIAVIENTRAMPNQLLIPYEYKEYGNFFITTKNDDIPYYDQFGITQFMYYLSQSELEAIRS